MDIAHSGKTADTLSVAGYWGGGYINLFDFRGTSYLTNGHADYLTKTFTITASQASGNGASNAWLEIYNSPSRADGTMSMTIGKWKLEKGSKPTPFIESYLDSGVDTTTVSDSSGYGRDADVKGTITFEDGSPRYNSCFSFNGSTANIIYRNETTFNYTDNFSYALWVKANYTGTTAQFIFTNGRADAGGFGYGIQNSGVTALNLRYGNKSYGVTIVQNEWTHIAFTKSGTLIKIYKNGALDNTYTFDGTDPTYSDGNGLGIGCFHYSGNIYPAYGSVSDFRIYCTPLTDTDIADLYHTSTKIDKSGNVHSFEFMEGSRTSITKTGSVIFPEIIEGTDSCKFSKNNIIANEFIER